MAEKRHLHHLGLIILCSFLTGTIGVDDTHKFCSSGGSVRLPCNNALSDCTSTTWIYSRDSKTVELITLGKKRTDTERHERLSLGSDCSLNINKVTKEDYGTYNCQQYVNGQKYGSDACVYLHFLHVSPSSSQIRSGSSVTLFCQLYYDQVSCDTLVRVDEVQLIWVNQAGVNLQIDSRYQISPGHCYSTLTTTLLDEDHNTEWRCLVTQRNQLKTSATYIVRYSGTSTTNTSTTNTSESQVTVIVMSVLAAVLIVALVSVLWVIYTKRARNKGGADISVDKDRDENKGTYESIKMSIPTTPNTNVQTADVIYSEVTASSKKQVNAHYIDSNDTVTYAAIRGT
ncbi:uncharacterized protein LOC127974708 isoform X2 [Carassius gibelio]|uniref:uncharacterized protein LOC127974708 isoform X2 n=1 Tax=Carassius gibelio TaxID=101364 RepID=UPI0022798D74|nr:uncharacterized protein LOC127974708 isoform X2 [Carassius gibelio]